MTTRSLAPAYSTRYDSISLSIDSDVTETEYGLDGMISVHEPLRCYER